MTTLFAGTSIGSSGGKPAVPAYMGSPPFGRLGGTISRAVFGSTSSVTPVVRAPWEVSF